ncbi:DUF4224 domain-containing protein [Thalassotalea euphylliae]|uniref:DUF4224 domain-containing protein n=1 Tax=Thalassotalea euphylliae TaxID=1655234 RepID=A0A3E0UF12_9GAMM|nr:DUF4224 domain-containing protein [Thalassotalea euphylliae]REL34705.1 DUF4224 domain-containing protein [Thalassotalea euphylliae]
MSSTFLSKDEVADLTGVKRKTTQMEQLAKQGIKFVLGRDGHPKVLRKSIEDRLGVIKPKNTEQEPILFNKV